MRQEGTSLSQPWLLRTGPGCARTPTTTKTASSLLPRPCSGLKTPRSTRVCAAPQLGHLHPAHVLAPTPTTITTSAHSPEPKNPAPPLVRRAARPRRSPRPIMGQPLRALSREAPLQQSRLSESVQVASQSCHLQLRRLHHHVLSGRLASTPRLRCFRQACHQHPSARIAQALRWWWWWWWTVGTQCRKRHACSRLATTFSEHLRCLLLVPALPEHRH
mmetsp:Transcript_9346/g.33042  ORF Transcript_9346/g.33042 Transcript_9346/m.33042 type:complete len:218 (+) Transcript_9346:1733-2386(+)